ncbi:proteasome assembly chaperone [Schizosaccharomyces pombe]|uniref:Uncharacterized protein C18.17c n=1 Tax=Schizosaccharomyces pombe (strain 972 / ATCC 24843) TaxID=284812 RepID=YQ9H_SCHPO|nr:putative proteasome non-ATPase regulatory subunit [Schizosaccharomyces pombe]O74867.1 RecName: Full=Uncharacterized protein C18.17c [Schizosaccharomyces pombe 972h-]CAA21431.1 26S proteasome non-ATPase regulatory subunit (predicted) [Schizosaccharomyces pombe]|eukprot:NP_588396.1 putative proteasome non-ATPase regulatory subunit [Schizosaccharomyces pombe]
MDSIELIPGLPGPGRRLLQLLKDLPSNPSVIVREIPDAIDAFRESITPATRPSCLGLLDTILSCFELPIPTEPIMKALGKLLEPMSWADLKKFGIESYLVTGLEHPSTDVEIFCLHLIRRANWEKKEIGEPLFEAIMACINSRSIAVSEEATVLLFDMADFPYYFNLIIKRFTFVDYEIMNSTLRVRWLTLFAKLSTKSPEYLEELIKDDKLVINGDNKDILLQINFVDVLGIMLEAPFTYEYISSEKTKYLDTIAQDYKGSADSYTDHIGLKFLPRLCELHPDAINSLDEKHQLFDAVRERMKTNDATSILLYGVFLSNTVVTQALIKKYGIEDEANRYVPRWLTRRFLMDEPGMSSFAHALLQPDHNLWMQLWRILPPNTLSTLVNTASSPIPRSRQLAYQCLLHIAQNSPIQIASEGFAIRHLLEAEGDHETCLLRFQVLKTMMESPHGGPKLPFGRYREDILKRLQQGPIVSGASTLKVAAETA